MRIFLTFLILLLIGCQSKTPNKNESAPVVSTSDQKSMQPENLDEAEKRFRDSLYSRENENYISKIEEIPNREVNAYRITIRSKNGNSVKSKIINTRPQMSRIIYCNDLYTAVSFPCGGPCHSEVFVFTSKTRPDEQYGYVEIVKNKPNIITHFKNEEFENLLVRNLSNNKEMKINISEIDVYTWDFIDSLTMSNNILEIHYTRSNDRKKVKSANIKSIL